MNRKPFLTVAARGIGFRGNMRYLKIRLFLASLLIGIGGCSSKSELPTSADTIITPSLLPHSSAVETATATLPQSSTVSPTNTSRLFESRWIDLVTPITGDVVSSPIRFRGRTNLTPEDPKLIVRLYDRDWKLLIETSVIVEGETGEVGTFSGEVAINDYTGLCYLEITEVEEGGASSLTQITLTNP